MFSGSSRNSTRCFNRGAAEASRLGNASCPKSEQKARSADLAITPLTGTAVRNRPELSENKPREQMRRTFMSGIQKFCRRLSTWHSTVAMLVVAAGCGGTGSPFAGPRYPVKGKVMLVDGKPLTAGAYFSPRLSLLRARRLTSAAMVHLNSRALQVTGFPRQATRCASPPRHPREQKRPSSQRSLPNTRTKMTPV